MSFIERPPRSYTSLSDRELEVLRLLAAGHTVKTIAAQLGRSEASINERLRDARRKTGVGSSRELARLLDAQKIWDKNLDLSTQEARAEAQRQPRDAGRTWLKGSNFMPFAISAAAAGLLVLVSNPISQAPLPQAEDSAAVEQPPLVGTWSLDVTRLPAEERPRSVTVAFGRAPDDKWTTRVDIVAPSGSRTYAESTAALDGVAVPVTGTMAFIDTVSLRQPAPNSLVMTLGKNGQTVSTRVYTVANDRKTMTETIVWAGGGIPKLETTRFDRVD
jgi:DNA-binding CsgD family transcriptional regulator